MKILANEDSQPVPLDVDAPLAASAEELRCGAAKQAPRSSSKSTAERNVEIDSADACADNCHGNGVGTRGVGECAPGFAPPTCEFPVRSWRGWLIRAPLSPS